MTKKFLFVMLAIALAFGMTVTSCKEADEEGFKDRTVNLTPAPDEENAIILTIKSAKWKNFTGNGVDDVLRQEALGEKLLEWTPASGSEIDRYLYLNKEYTLIDNNKLKVSFSKYTLAGVGIIGSGTLKLKNLSTTELMAELPFIADGINAFPDWTIGKNDPVTITIR